MKIEILCQNGNNSKDKIIVNTYGRHNILNKHKEQFSTYATQRKVERSLDTSGIFERSRWVRRAHSSRAPTSP